MSSWAPQPAGLQEILQTIHESTDMSTVVQRNITQVQPYSLLPEPLNLSTHLLEIEQLHSRARLYRIPGIHPFSSTTRRGPYPLDCRLSPQEQLAFDPDSGSRSRAICERRSVARVCGPVCHDQKCCESGCGRLPRCARAQKLARVPPAAGEQSRLPRSRCARGTCGKTRLSRLNG